MELKLKEEACITSPDHGQKMVVQGFVGCDFRIITDHIGMKFRGSSPMIASPADLNVLAKAIGTAFKYHQKFAGQMKMAAAQIGREITRKKTTIIT